MADTFRRGNIEDYYVTFLTLENKEPISVVNPVITIRHIDEAYNLVTDINEAPMVLVGESTYYFRWNIPSNAYIGTYNVETQGIVDGEYSESNSTVLIKA